MPIQLSDPLAHHIRVLEPQQKGLEKLSIRTVGDLLFHFPVRYGDTAEISPIGSLAAGAQAVIFGKLSNLKTKKGFRSKVPMAEGLISDESGSIKVIWFHQPYIAKMYPDGTLIRAEGKIADRKGERYLSNPQLERISTIPVGVGHSLFGEEAEHIAHTLYPVYPESKGVTSNWIYHAVTRLIANGALETVNDPIPEDILKRYNLPSRKTSLVWIHAPQKQDDARSARKRFAFEEVFFIQLGRQRDRLLAATEHAFVINPKSADTNSFLQRFPFTPTGAQQKAIEAILADTALGTPMSRLLEGDVGSGKTLVAAAIAHATVTTRPKNQTYGNLQVAYMAPTEILATQHFASFMEYFAHLPISIGLLTGSGCKKFPSKINPRGATDISRAQLLKWTAKGEIAIIIGTHALIQKSVRFGHLGLVIIDEQHRFGTAQRKKLVRKEEGLIPHLLSMTATPIPRTLALTVYGDLDLTLLDEMPAGRKPIITEIVTPERRNDVYELIRAQLKAGRQAYVICPRIDEPDPSKEMALSAKSVKEEAKRLAKDVFPEYRIGILHSKMKPAEKENVMLDFKKGLVTILVATSVVEVGVNVPNATIIVLEGAERFGLAQLHQLRGRVLRGTHQAYCYAFAQTKSATSQERLKALVTAKNGFELAEHDLKFRGAGELYGKKQWGLSDLGMEALRNIKMVEAARTEAIALLKNDLTLAAYPYLKNEIETSAAELHFE